jgi:hypothetical protein
MNTPPNVCSNTAYLNSVEQKSRFQLFNIPANRYDNLASNPYIQINPNTGLPYTKFDLDMRRKAEVLKYNSNRVSTQTNNLTKAQIYAQAIKGSYQQRTYSQEFIKQNTINGVLQICPPGVIITTPSSASDVPGNLLLYDDPTIPLYNYVNDSTTTSYGIINPPTNPYSSGFQFTHPTDILSTATDSSTIFTTYMFNTPSPNYLFSFDLPISLEFQGSLLNTVTSGKSPATFQIQFNEITTNVNYSYSPMTINSSIVNTINNQPINNNLLFDISVNPLTSSFRGSYYLGKINVSNISLPVALGYIFDFQLSVSYSVLYPYNSQYSAYFNTPIITSTLSPTSITNYQTNCVITPTAVIPPTPAFPASLSVIGLPV